MRKSLYTSLYQEMWRIRAGKSGRRLFELDAELSSHERLEAHELHALQLKRLRSLLEYVYVCVPFYRQQFDNIGIHPKDICSLEDLVHLPVLTKDDLRAHADDGTMLAAGLDAQHLRRNATGGSTGIPVVFYQDEEQWLYATANKMRYRRWHHCEWGDKTAILWGAHRDVGSGWRNWARKALRRERWLNAYAISENQMQHFVDMLSRWEPRLIIGYVSVLDLLAGYMQKNGIHPVRSLAIEAAAEKLWPDQRQRIQAGFGVPVFDAYGSREFGSMAAECPMCNGLHIFSDTFIIEIIQNGHPAAPGELGEILVTSLTNRAMPLIRYQIGDLGRWHTQPTCSCGRHFPRLAEIVGRSNALVTTVDGRYVHGAFFSRLFYEMPGITKFRVHQKDILQVDVVYQSAQPMSQEQEQALRYSILKNLGQQVHLTIQRVQDITPLPSGKLGYLVSDVPVDFIHRRV